MSNPFNLIEYPGISNFPLLDSWYPSLCFCGLYLIGIKYFTIYMKQQPKEWEISKVMAIYNFGMVFWSLFMMLGFVYFGSYTGLTMHCWQVYNTNDVYYQGMLFIFYNYYISKFVEFMDTFFFIARKRFQLVTVLHVYHHTIMSATTYLPVKYGPGGYIVMPFALNCFVHVFMYLYYGLAALGPKYRSYLFWKKYVTIIQIIQFILVLSHTVFYLQVNCPYPRVLMALAFGNAFIFLVLFSNFYINSYKPNSAIISCSEISSKASTELSNNIKSE